MLTPLLIHADCGARSADSMQGSKPEMPNAFLRLASLRSADRYSFSLLGEILSPSGHLHHLCFPRTGDVLHVWEPRERS